MPDPGSCSAGNVLHASNLHLELAWFLRGGVRIPGITACTFYGSADVMTTLRYLSIPNRLIAGITRPGLANTLIGL